jgi:hypothetical protein
MRPIKLRTDALSRFIILYVRTAGSPKSREAHGDGNPIVVSGVTSTQRQLANTSYRAKGVRNYSLEELERYA